MTAAQQILVETRSVIVVDWPSRDVPDTLARAGLAVYVKGGPGPDDFSQYELQGDEIAVRPLGRAPAKADLVYCYRPSEELPAIVELAVAAGARAIWRQSEAPDPEARGLVEQAGLAYVDDVYIADAVRQLRS